MSTSQLTRVEMTDIATHVELTDDELILTLADGRAMSAPLVWFPRLLNASAEQRRRWQLIGGGEGIHWPDLDEDLSVAGLLRGERSTVRQGS
jgi:Protein of unknown function (DUF2442)